MKRHNQRGSALQHYSVTVLLTVCFLVAVILLNVLFSRLSNAFDWWIDMSGEQIFDVSDVSVSVLEDGVASFKDQHGQDVSLRIIFCIPEENVRESELGYYILNCVENYKHALDFVELRFLNLALDPTLAESYLLPPLYFPFAFANATPSLTLWFINSLSNELTAANIVIISC